MANLLEVTTGRLLENIAEREGEREAVVYPDRDLRLSYRTFNDLCRQTARGMMALGIEKGDHVAVWTANKPEWLVSQFATGKAGAVLVTVNTSYQEEELAYLLSQSESSTLILQPTFKTTSYIDILYRLVPELKTAEPGRLQSERFPHLKRVIIVDGGEEHYPGIYLWESLLEAGNTVSEDALDKRMASLDKDEVINMQYTSGTTGFPKGVMLTHSNIVNNGLNIAECMNLTHEDRLCIPVPFFHCFGCVLGILACVNKGTTMVIVEEFDPKMVMEAVHREKCTGLHGVPTMFIAELNHPDFAEYDFSALRTGIMAGSNCPVEVMKAVMDRMGAHEVTIAYGQTESSPVITQTRTDDSLERKTETVGRALPNVEVKIVAPGTDKEVPAGTQGELCTRGYHVMKGYYNDPEATAEVLTTDGWLHTGDLAVMDEHGYCTVTGRMKDMIIRGGENIYPREIEEFLYRHPSILDVQIVGVADEKYGEEIGAYVRLKEGQQATVEAIKDFCRGSISHHKIPRHITFVDSYPMTASGKIQKFKLREEAKEIFLGSSET
ncbi:AMP-binding protein [Salicibibacter cibi]|uniref:AMP-binding protein n=1 Tax=Salicibibacter cibi TaxID=2743001 RepID=A0A7T7CEE6_9BACI|nr:AMP-binding protein [Salicibibacter cibi]QQK78959.1 AMP-binding protein [Salicibibacter cibi]